MSSFDEYRKKLQVKYGANDKSSEKEDEEKKVKKITTNGDSSFDDFRTKMMSKYATDKVKSSDVESWFRDADATLKSMQDYHKQNSGKYVAEYGGDIGKRISDLMTSSGDIYNYLQNHKSEYGNFKELSDIFSQYQSALEQNDFYNYQLSRYYSQFDSEDSYNKWYETYKEKESVLGAEDFKHYSQIGANIKNPSTKEAEPDIVLFGKGIGGKEVGNIVTYSRDNADALAFGEANGGGSYAGGKYLYTFMTDDEVAVYNYYLGKGDTEKANNYLASLEDTLNQRQGGQLAENLEGHKFAEMIFGIGTGLEQFAYGVGNLDNLFTGAEADPLSATQYAAPLVREDMDGAWGVAYDLANTTANMLPSILVGSVTAGIGGNLTLGASAAGNAYAEMRRLGYDDGASQNYAFLVGASEGVLSYFLGGISKLGGGSGGIFQTVASKIVPKLDNAIARVAIQLGGNMLDEGLEEAVQEVLDPVFKMAVTGEDFEGINLEDVLYSGLLGALSAGFLEGGPTIVGTAIQSNQAKNIYGVEPQSLVTESLDIDPENAHAQRMQERLDKGKNISGYQLNRLAETNEQTLKTQDKAKMRSAVETRLTELGETGDIGKLADVIVKARSGEQLTRSERALLTESKYGRRVSTEMNPQSIESGEYTSSWAENIGTERINERAYNKALYDLANEKAGVALNEEKTPLTVNASNKEIATESEFKASEDGKTRIGDTEVSIKEIASVKDGEITLRLDDGSTVKAIDVEFGSSDEGLLYENVVRMGLNAATANAFINGYDGSMSVSDYAFDFRQAYRYGELGIPKSEMSAKEFSSRLTESVKDLAYNHGAIDAKYKASEKQSVKAKIASTGVKNTENIASKGKKNGKLHNTLKPKNELQRTSLKALGVLAEALNIDIYTFESPLVKGRRVGENGSYDPATRTMRIDLYAGADGKGTMLFTAAHELTHHIREKLPAKFKAFADFLFEQYGEKGISVSELIAKKRADLEANGRTKGKTDAEIYDLAYEEVVADACENFLADGEAVAKIAELKVKDKTLWETIKDFITKLVARIKTAYEGLKPDSREGRLVAEMLDSAEKLKAMWTEMLVEASEIVEIDTKTESVSPMFSERTWTASEYVTEREKTAKAISKSLNVDIKTALKYIDDINGVARLIADDRARLDYEPNLDDKASVLKPNSEYKFSVDMSTLCAKRLLFTGTFDAIQKALPNMVFDSEDIVTLRKMMQKRGYEVACGICYVESTRREIGRITQDFIDSYKESQKTGKPITRVNSEGKVVDLKKTKDQKETTADKSTDKFFAEKDYTPTLADLNTTDIDLVKRDHPLVYEAYLNFMNARGQAKPKLLETRAEYKGEILKHFKYTSAVNARNNAGGLRLQSFSDFEVPHMIDMMQIVMDMARVGLKSQAYTKVPAFAEIFGDSGVKINLSLIAKGDGLDANGNLIFDDVEGINHKEAFKLRDKYSKNVGTILVGKTDAHIIAAMADPRIDYIIPFHKSSWKESLYDALGLTGYADYTDYQNEKPIDKDRKIKNFDPSEYWDFTKSGDENAQIYLEKCREDGRIPKFPQFQGYPGYWKLLIDFKMYDNDGIGSPQEVVRPIFNTEASERILREYKGGHKSFPVAKDVVEDFVKEHKEVKYSDRDSFVEDKYFKSQMSKWEDLKHGSYVKVGTIGKKHPLYSVGMPEGTLRYDVDKLKKNMVKHGDYLDVDLLKAIPDIIANPIAISEFSAENTVSVFGNIFVGNSPMMVGVTVSKDRAGNDISKVRTYNTRRDVGKLITDETILYLNEDKKRTRKWFQACGIQVPLGETKFGFIRSISQNSDFVKRKFSDRTSDRVIPTGIELPESMKVDKNGKPSSAQAQRDAGYMLSESKFYQLYSAHKLTFSNRGGEINTVIEKIKRDGFISSTSIANVLPTSTMRHFDYDRNGKVIFTNVIQAAYAPKKGDYVLFVPNSYVSKDDIIKNGFKPLEYEIGVVEYDYQPYYELYTKTYDKVYEQTHEGNVLYSDRTSYAPTFYSHMGKVIGDIRLEKMGAGGVVSYLKGKGIKNEEIKWSGIEAFLEGKKSVTKAELQEFVAGSQLQIEEEMSDSVGLKIEQDGEDYIVKDNEGNIVDTWSKTHDPGDPNLVGWISEEEGQIASDINEIREYVSDWYSEESTRWSQYRLDGGTNYRELVFKMSNSSYSNQAMKAHWGEDAEGVLAHARIQDMTTADGKKMLFIEEIQSDWHNEGHQRGYVDEAKLVSVENTELFKNKHGTYELYRNSGEYLILIGQERLKQRFPNGISESDIHRGLVDQYNREQSNDSNDNPLTPDAPFKDTYHEYVLKRLLRMAAEEGYDSIGWTPALIQSERWSDEFAEGYRIEYDQDIPKFLRKYGKKWGATVGKSSLEGNGDVTYKSDGGGKYDSIREWFDSEKELIYIVYGDHLKGKLTVKENGNILHIENKETGEKYPPKLFVHNGNTEVWSMSIPDSMKDSVLHEGQVMYSDRPTDSFSNRSLLANALESVAQNDIERNKLKEYKQKIDLINAEEQKLHDLREQIKELSFKKGPRDTESIKGLQFEEKQAANRINVYDKQLLSLESTKALKGVLEREKQMAYKRAEQKGKEALKAQREKDRERNAKTQRELMNRYQESRKKGIESRHKTEMRYKIKTVVNELYQYLEKGTKEKHVPISLQKPVAEALAAVNMDTVSAEERIAKKRAEMLNAKNPEAIEKLAKEIEHIQEMGGNMEKKLSRLKTAYDSILNSDDPLVANSHDEVIANTIDKVIEIVGDTPLRDMSLYQLEAVYDMYRMVLTSIRNANKTYAMEKGKEISVLANTVISDLDGKKRNPLNVADTNFAWNNLKPVYAFERIGSRTFTKLFNAVRAGEDVWAKDMSEAQAFREDQSKKNKFSSWDFEKKYTFRSQGGKTFELDLGEIMSVYAFAKDEHSKGHLIGEGFVFDPGKKVVKKVKGGIEVKVNLEDATSYNLSEEILSDIISKLTPEQKAFADAMQDYLSTTMGEKGNEVSLELYEIKLFKNKNYFPLKVAPQYMAVAKEKAQGDVKIKNKGFTKERKEGAKNPIVLSSFMDVWANHVNEMSMYHAFTLPLEDFYRVFNYKTPRLEGYAPMSVNASIQNAFGEAATTYIEQLLKDLNGGARSDPRESWGKAMMSNFKKASVMASLSVVIQQPSAIIRAQALVNPKYFVGKKASKGGHKKAWEEVKKYAPVAVIKEMGYFDTGMGKGSVEWLKGEKTLMDKVDDVVSKAPALADEMTWVAIWNAVKRETLYTHKDLKPNSDEFLKAVGERFTEVIVKTQVYDSTLARSANMRSKGSLMNMWTAFMAEPTTSINMIQDSFRKGKRGKYTLKVLGAVYGSVLLNSALVSIVYAMRDDDDDETYLEKYLSRLTTEMIDGVNPLTYIPFVKDIWSVLQGFDVERADMSLITKVSDSLQQLFKVINKDTSNMDEEELAEHNKAVNEAILSITDNLANLVGVPVKNVRRDLNGIINGFNTIKEDMNGRETTAGSLGDTILEDVKDSVPVWGWFPNESKGDKLYDAIMNGDTAYIERLKGAYKDDKAYESAMRKALRENDPRIHDAAVARYAGRNDEYMRIAREIKAEGHFSQDDIVAAINAEISKLKPDKESEVSKPPFVTADDYYNSIVNGDTGTAQTILDMLVKEKLEEGYLTVEAKDSVASSFSTKVKEAYMDGNLTSSKAKSLLISHGNKDDSEAETELKKCDFELKYDVAWSERARAYRLGKITESNLITAVMDIEDESREDAELYIRFLDLELANPTVDITVSDAKSYFEYAEPSGIRVDVFIDYKEQTRGLTSDKDANGNPISGSLKKKVMAVIDALPITSAQKDALYFTEGWAKNKLWQAPWH